MNAKNHYHPNGRCTWNFSILFVYLSPSLKTPLYKGVSVWQQMCDKWQINPCFPLLPPHWRLFHYVTSVFYYIRHQMAIKAYLSCFNGFAQLVSSIWNGLCGASEQTVRRHCDTRSEALWHPFRGTVTAVQRHCLPCTTALFTLCNGIVHTVQRYCSHCEMRSLPPCGGTEERAQKCCKMPFPVFICHLSHICCHTEMPLYKGVFSDGDK